jgi:hypothetical protein
MYSFNINKRGEIMLNLLKKLKRQKINKKRPTFDDFLEKEGIKEEVQEIAIKEYTKMKEKK